MRPQLFPAETIARLTPQPASRSSNRTEASTSTDGFQSVLKRIRSSRTQSKDEAPSSEPDRKPKSTDTDPANGGGQAQASDQPVATDTTAADGSQTQPQDAANGADAAPTTEPVEPQAAQTGESSDETRPLPTPTLTQGGVYPLEETELPPKLPTHSPKEGGGEDAKIRPLARSSQPIQSAVAEAAADASVILSAPVARPTNAANSTNTAEETAEEPATTTQAQSVQVEDAAAVEPVEEVPADQVKNRPAAKPRSAKNEGRTHHEALRDLTKSTSIQDRKMAIMEGEADADVQSADSSTGKAAGGKSVSPRLNVSQASTERTTQSASVTIGAASGDAAAASVAAFMLAGTDVDGSLGGQMQTASTSAAVTTGTAAPAGSSQSTNVQAVTAAGAASSFGTEGSPTIDDAAKVLAASSNGSRHEVTLRLEPPELGQLKVQIRMQHQAMTMQVDADSPTVARLIESRLSDLRDALSLHGIKMDRTDVVVRSPAPSDTNTQQQNQQQGGSAEQGRAAGDESGDWQGQNNQTADSQDQSSSWQFGGQEMADSDGNAGAILAEEVLAGVGLDAATELSLDLVA